MGIYACKSSTNRVPMESFGNSFDIFRGILNSNPVWVESADGLHHAIARMQVLAQIEPTDYFVFNVTRNQLFAEWHKDTMLTMPGQDRNT